MLLFTLPIFVNYFSSFDRFMNTFICLHNAGVFQELFELLQDTSRMPVGSAPADILAVELTAGGLSPEHTNFVSS